MSWKRIPKRTVGLIKSETTTLSHHNNVLYYSVHLVLVSVHNLRHVASLQPPAHQQDRGHHRHLHPEPLPTQLSRQSSHLLHVLCQLQQIFQVQIQIFLKKYWRYFPETLASVAGVVVLVLKIQATTARPTRAPPAATWGQRPPWCPPPATMATPSITGGKIFREIFENICFDRDSLLPDKVSTVRFSAATIAAQRF